MGTGSIGDPPVYRPNTRPGLLTFLGGVGTVTGSKFLGSRTLAELG
ncbi:hypothetical protein [Actinacidiphila glaucinigra]|nr:hypothetical protein [Actinacidiphila glaucinigra]